MKVLLPALILLMHASALAQRSMPRVNLKEAIADFPYSRLELRTAGPVSIDVNQGARAAYEALAEIAGLNIIFDADFRSGVTAPFRIENEHILDAFDLLSARTGSFVEVLNARTIIVAPDNSTKHRDYDFLVLKTFYLPDDTTPQRITEFVTTLRKTLSARYIATSTTANAIIMRDTPSRIASAEKTLAFSTRVAGGIPTATRGEVIPGSGAILTLQGGAIQSSAPAMSALKPDATRPVSMDVTESTRTTFESLARMAGLNIIFDPDFRSQEGMRFKVEDLDVMNAIDLLAMQTRSFFAVLDSKTIMVAPDNQAKRRDLENVLVKTFYLPNTSQRELIEVVTALRTLLNGRYLAVVGAANAIVMRDTPTRMALAERIISDLRGSGGVVTSTVIPAGSENGFVLNDRASRALTGLFPLQPRVAGPLSFDVNDTARGSYEAVAAMAGLRVIFDDNFKDGAAAPFKVQNVHVADALDFLALQTRTIWRVMDRDTIVAAPDSQTVRAGFLNEVTKTIRLNKAQQPGGTEVITALRTILGLRKVSALEDSIVVQDTAANVDFAERIVADLNSPPAR